MIAPLKYLPGIFFIMFLSGRMEGQSFYVSLQAESSEVICAGDSILARVGFFGGTAPYTIEISNGQGVYKTFEDVGSSFSFYIIPEASDQFYISKATDRRGRKGKSFGTVNAEVHEPTPVTLHLDRTAFLESDSAAVLTSSPDGAEFSGPGVTGNLFDPGAATAEGSPHLITCVYTNPYGCVSTDQVDVYVLSGISEVTLMAGGNPVQVICGEGSAYTIRGSNSDLMPGTFKLFIAGTGTEVAGSISDPDLTDNEALLDPHGLEGSYTIEYAYGIRDLEVKAYFDFRVSEILVNGISGLPDTVCRNGEPLSLFPDVDPPDPDAEYQISGPGISGSMEDGFVFTPGDTALPDGPVSITLEFASSAGCNSLVNKIVFVGADPGVELDILARCIEPEGSNISFLNLTAGKDLVTGWLWEFGDPDSGPDNTSHLEEPDHFYREAGSKSIRLEATTRAGCLYSHKIDTLLVDVPVVDITWTHECFIEGHALELVPSVSSVFSGVDTLLWLIQTEEEEVLDLTGQDYSGDPYPFVFPDPGSYEISLLATNEAGCSSIATKYLFLRPVIHPVLDTYHETFDTSLLGWNTGSQAGASSWKLDPPDFTGFHPEESDLAWVTDLPEYVNDIPEQSWVKGPCFDLSGMDSPVIELDIMKSFYPGKGGAVLQYSVPGEGEWITLGTAGEGEHWYNDTAILYEPGGSSAGWSLPEFDPDSFWVRAEHPFDRSIADSLVQFRIAFASTGAQEVVPGQSNQGFAFDNFSIRERNIRRSVLEYFTNILTTVVADADSAVKKYALDHAGRLYDLHYHMDTPMQDPLFDHNPDPPTTRSFYYGIPAVPYAVLNGGVTSDTRFDLSVSPVLEEQSLAKASGESPLFDVTVGADFYPDHLVAHVTVSCLDSSYGAFLQLYTVIAEKEVTAYPELTPDSAFRNVVLDILPSPAGKLIGDSWTKGQAADYEFDWDYASYLENPEDLCIVAFIQDRSSGLILQAGETSYKFGVGIAVHSAKGMNFTLYPNPAHDQVHLSFKEAPLQEGQLMFTDLSGRIQLYEHVIKNKEHYQIDISALPKGIYLVVWRQLSGEIMGTGKIIRE